MQTDSGLKDDQKPQANYTALNIIFFCQANQQAPKQNGQAIGLRKEPDAEKQTLFKILDSFCFLDKI